MLIRLSGARKRIGDYNSTSQNSESRFDVCSVHLAVYSRNIIVRFYHQNESSKMP